MQRHRPRIGVTSADDPTPDTYVRAVERSGGDPVVLRSVPADVERDLAGLDGLLVTGGADIEPARYGMAPHAATDAPDRARDAYELAAICRAQELGLPTLAICRGLQIANVAWGGTLLQHLPDVVAADVVHRDMERKFETFPEHVVTIEADSKLAAILGTVLCETNASHHQAVDHVGTGLRVVARTADGIIEALERPAEQAFWLALQWHPERLLDADNGRSERVFAAFIAAARAYLPRHP